MEVVQEMTDDDQEWGEVAQQVVVGQVEAEQHFVVESEQFQRPEQIVEALEETDQFQNQEQVTENVETDQFVLVAENVETDQFVQVAENVETDQFLSQEQVAENIETDKFLNEEQVVKEVEEVPHVGKDVMDQLRNKFSKPQRTEIHSTGPTLPKGLFARLREKYLSNSTKPGFIKIEGENRTTAPGVVDKIRPKFDGGKSAAQPYSECVEEPQELVPVQQHQKVGLMQQEQEEESDFFE